MPAVVAAPSLASWLVPTIVGAGATAGAGIYGAHAAGSAATKGARYATDAANRAAQLESQSAADALAFQREQEAQRQKEWQSTQDRNYGIYQEERDYTRGLTQRRYGDLGPYRNLGTKAIGQLLVPINQRPAPGSVADLMGRG